MSVTLARNAKRRFKKLKEERQSWVKDWKALGEQFLPRRMMFLDEGDKPNDGKINRKLIDDAPVRYMRVLSAGLQGGLTSPARPWFKLGVQDADLEEMEDVKKWLGIIQKRITSTLSRSNFYSAIHTLYSELGTFGTEAMYILEDADTVLRFVALTVGEYYLAADNRDIVNVIFRELEMTADQIVQEFGEENVTESVKRAYKDSATKDEYFRVVSGCFPNENRKEGVMGWQGQEYVSVYWEDQGQADEWLGIRGYDERPFVAPRWDVKGNSVYGFGPGIDSLSDAKQLQSQKKTMLKVMHKEADPPMNAPASLKRASTVPGAINYIAASGDKFEPAQTVRSNPQSAMIAVEATKKDLAEGLYNDLFRMLAFANADMTATEVRQRVEEKLILLGPVLERLQSEMLDPVIDRVFSVMMKGGYFPPPPEALQGRTLKIEYISLLAQAQKMLGTATIEQFFTFIQAQGNVFQDSLDIYDYDKAAEEYGNMLGVPPEIIRGADEREEIRFQRAEMQRLAMQAQMESQGIEDIKNLSQTKTEGDNALSAVTGGMVSG